MVKDGNRADEVEMVLGQGVVEQVADLEGQVGKAHGLLPVMKLVQDTLEMTGIDDRIGATVPPASSCARFGIRPRAVKSRTSGTLTPSSPITATRDAGAAICAPRRSRSRRPS